MATSAAGEQLNKDNGKAEPAWGSGRVARSRDTVSRHGVRPGRETRGAELRRQAGMGAANLVHAGRAARGDEPRAGTREVERQGAHAHARDE